MKADWIRMKNGGDSLTVFCKRCDATFSIKLPISITTLLTITEPFGEKHRKCKERKP